MKKRMIWMLTLLCTVVQGIWAQTIVSTEKQLTDAIAEGDKNIQLTGDIQLSKYLDIDGKTVTIDLYGHKLSRNLGSHSSTGHVIWAHNGSDLTLKSSKAGGSIEGGKANNGGAIHIPYGNTVTATNVTFQNNSAADHAGAIWNNGTLKATDCTFANNRADDVGAIYNSKTDSGCGTASLKNCTFTGNVGDTGAGALANAIGNTVMTIDGCTIQDNTADSNGGGIWNGGTLNMQGAVKVTGNKRTSGSASNVFLKTGKVITVTGDLTGSTIGIDLENISGTFANGWDGKNPSGIFTADFSNDLTVDLEGNEACVTTKNPVCYIERSWDATNKRVVSTEKRMVGFKIDGEDIPREGEYKEVTNAPGDSPNEWFRMGGYSNMTFSFI